jgi:hypothetical protein
MEPPGVPALSHVIAVGAGVSQLCHGFAPDGIELRSESKVEITAGLAARILFAPTKARHANPAAARNLRDVVLMRNPRVVI